MTTLSIRLAEALSDIEVEDFVDWFSSSPEFRSAGLRLEVIKKINTVAFIFELVTYASCGLVSF